MSKHLVCLEFFKTGLWVFSSHRWSWDAVTFFTWWTSGSWVSSVTLDQEQVSR